MRKQKNKTLTIPILALTLLCNVICASSSFADVVEIIRPYIPDDSYEKIEGTFDLSGIPEEEEKSYYVATNDVCLYKGPSTRFSKLDDGYCLPSDIIVTTKYYDDLGWSYFEHDAHAGWAMVRRSDSPESQQQFAERATNNDIFTNVGDLELHPTPYSEEIIATIPAEPFSDVKYDYSIYNQYYIAYHVSLDDVSGWYVPGGIAYVDEKYISIFSDSMNITTLDGSDVICTVPKDKELYGYYSFSTLGDNPTYYYYAKELTASPDENTCKGWVLANAYGISRTPEHRGEFNKRTVENAPVSLYDLPDSDNVVATVPAGEYRYDFYYQDYSGNTWYHLKEGQFVGWANEKVFAEYSPYQEDPSSPDEPSQYYNELEEYIIKLIWCTIGALIVSISIVVALSLKKKSLDSLKTQESTAKSPEQPVSTGIKPLSPNEEKPQEPKESQSVPKNNTQEEKHE